MPYEYRPAINLNGRSRRLLLLLLLLSVVLVMRRMISSVTTITADSTPPWIVRLE